MLRPDPVRRFALRLAVFYGLLIAPWPGLRAGYAQAFRQSFNSLFGWLSWGQRVSMEPPPRANLEWDVELFMTNADLSARWHMEFSSRAWGYLPTAGVMALLLASATPWRRRWKNFAVALLLIHAFIGLRVAAALLYGLNWGGALRLSSFEQKLAEILLLGFSGSPVTSYVAPVIIWLLVDFWGDQRFMLLRTRQPNAD